MTTAPARTPIKPVASTQAEALRRAIHERAEQRGALTLGALEQAVLGVILRQFPLLGQAPSRHAIACALKEPYDRIITALEQLDRRDLVYLDQHTQEIQIAYPFSSTPTAHRVEIWAAEGRHQHVFAVCAVDALGISFFLRREVAIASSCPLCSGTVTLEVRHGEITVHKPMTTIVWVGTNRGVYAATSVCPTMNFFCGDTHLADWCDGHQAEGGHRLTMGEALYLGQGLFESLRERAESGYRTQTGI